MLPAYCNVLYKNVENPCNPFLHFIERTPPCARVAQAVRDLSRPGRGLPQTHPTGQAHSFDASLRFGQWQEKARGALIELTGLQQMEKDLGGFTPKIRLGQAEKTNEPFTRALCSMETEPGVVIPFYLLIPKDASKAQPRPLLLCPHGHDKLGLHSYAGAFKDEKHRKTVLEKEGDIGAQAARRGFVVIAPATRGLAEEVLVPDPKGRHGKRPCRAQLIHCLLAGRTPIAERVWDMQRLLDWAEKHPLLSLIPI